MGALSVEISPQSRLYSPSRAVSAGFVALTDGWWTNWAFPAVGFMVEVEVIKWGVVLVLSDFGLEIFNGLVLLDDRIEILQVQWLPDVIALSQNLVKDGVLADRSLADISLLLSIHLGPEFIQACFPGEQSLVETDPVVPPGFWCWEIIWSGDAMVLFIMHLLVLVCLWYILFVYKCIIPAKFCLAVFLLQVGSVGVLFIQLVDVETFRIYVRCWTHTFQCLTLLRCASRVKARRRLLEDLLEGSMSGFKVWCFFASADVWRRHQHLLKCIKVGLFMERTEYNWRLLPWALVSYWTVLRGLLGHRHHAWVIFMLLEDGWLRQECLLVWNTPSHRENGAVSAEDLMRGVLQSKYGVLSGRGILREDFGRLLRDSVHQALGWGLSFYSEMPRWAQELVMQLGSQVQNLLIRAKYGASWRCRIQWLVAKDDFCKAFGASCAPTKLHWLLTKVEWSNRQCRIDSWYLCVI